MNKVSDILSRKGGKTVAVPPQTNVIDALRLMASNNIGSVLVMENDTYLGIVTERDYSRKVVLQGKNSADTKVSEIMTREVISCSEDQEIEEGAQLMADKQVRRLMITNKNEELVGIVSLGDLATHLNKSIAGETLEEISLKS